MLTLLAAVVLCVVGVTGVAWAATRWTAARRTRRWCSVASEGLQAARRDWWEATRAYDSDAAAAALRLRRYGQAVLDSATALETLERETSRACGWPGPPPQPHDLLPGAARRGPREWWQGFDRAYEACCGLLHPADDCYALGQAALALADWIEKHDPEPPGEERAGPDAAFVHAVSAPCLATMTAASVVPDDGALRLDIAALENRAAEDGGGAQRIVLSLAETLIGRCDSGPTVGELLTLDDTDACYALEAVALARGLRRVYPAQRPELLWMRAALARSDGDDGAALSRGDTGNEQTGADE